MKKTSIILITLFLSSSLFSTVQAINSSTNQNSTLIPPSTKSSNQVKNIADSWMPDQNLQTIVSNQLGITVDQLTPDALKDLTSLSLTTTPISSLTGLEYATNLSTVTISNQPTLTDLSPLANAAATMQSFTLTGDFSKLTNLDTIGKFEDLRTLNLAGPDNTQINKNMSFIKNLLKLRVLTLTNINMKDYSQDLTDLIRLEYLAATYCSIDNDSFTQELRDIVTLNLSHNDLTSIETIGTNYTSILRDLDLSHNHISDITTLYEKYYLYLSLVNLENQTITLPTVEFDQSNYFQANPIKANHQIELTPIQETNLPAGTFNITKDGIDWTSLTSKTSTLNSSFSSIENIGSTPIEYSGTITQNYVRKSANLTVSYQDQDGNEIAPTQSFEFLVNDSYDVTNDNLALNISGYTLDESNLPTELSGIMPASGVRLIYTYSKDKPADNKDDSINSKSSSNSRKNTPQTIEQSKKSAILPKTGEKKNNLSTLGILITLSASFLLLTNRKNKRI